MSIIHLQSGDEVYIRNIDKILSADSQELGDWIRSELSHNEFVGFGQGEGYETYWDDGFDGHGEYDPYASAETLQKYAQYADISDPESERFDPQLALALLPEDNKFRERVKKWLKKHASSAE